MCDGSTVPTTVSLADIAARLEELLPGLYVSAVAAGQAAHARSNAMWSRLRPDRPLTEPAEPGPSYVVEVDHLIDYARLLGGRIAAQEVGDDMPFEALAPYLRALAGEDLLVVDDYNLCTRASTDALLADADVRIVGGDAVIVGTSSPRVIVVHHSGWIFDLDLARP